MNVSVFVRILNRLFKIQLAEKWDNVGLLIEPSRLNNITRICLTNDLTEPVLDEAISLGANFIISYHPPIFRPIKRLIQSSWKERLVLKCIEHSIAVYSPHTALDAVSGGINDWLLSPFDLKYKFPLKMHACSDQLSTVTTSFNVQIQEYCLRNRVPPLNVNILSPNGRFIEVPITEDYPDSKPNNGVVFLPEEGSGRIALLSEGYTIQSAVEAYKKLFNVAVLKVAVGYGKQFDSAINCVAVCAGSGGSMFSEEPMARIADLLVTGEATHHEQLDAISRGTTIITAGHSVSERGFLSQNLRPWLISELQKAGAPPLMIDVALTDNEPGVYV